MLEKVLLDPVNEFYVTHLGSYLKVFMTFRLLIRIDVAVVEINSIQLPTSLSSIQPCCNYSTKAVFTPVPVRVPVPFRCRSTSSCSVHTCKN